jgi:hypothetical protein
MPLSRILLPIGIDGLFVPITEGTTDTTGFHAQLHFDGGALRFLSQELISQGAIGIGTNPGSLLSKHRDDLDITLRTRVTTLDRRRELEGRAAMLVRPIAGNLDFDPDQLAICDFPVGYPQSYCLSLPQTRRQLWSDVVLTMNATYHVLLGIKNRMQIDVPLHAYRQALLRLREAVDDSAAETTIAFLLALVSSYRFETVRAVKPMLSDAADEWVEAFEILVEDEEFR